MLLDEAVADPRRYITRTVYGQDGRIGRYIDHGAVRVQNPLVALPLRLPSLDPIRDLQVDPIALGDGA